MKKLPEPSLPLKGKIKIIQGWNSKFSHKKLDKLKLDLTYSVDFLVPEKTPVYAAMDGTVFYVLDKFSENYSGTDINVGKKLSYKTNVIILKHEDDLHSAYLHIYKGSATVKVGDKVKEGYPIALSGNVGWSTHPHLHFMLFKFNIEGYLNKTVPFKFKNFNLSLDDVDVQERLK